MSLLSASDDALVAPTHLSTRPLPDSVVPQPRDVEEALLQRALLFHGPRHCAVGVHRQGRVGRNVNDTQISGTLPAAFSALTKLKYLCVASRCALVSQTLRSVLLRLISALISTLRNSTARTPACLVALLPAIAFTAKHWQSLPVAYLCRTQASRQHLPHGLRARRAAQHNQPQGH